MNEHDGNLILGSANVEKIERFKMNAGKADFGDDPHLGGQALGDAIVCWSIDGRVAVKGKIFSDNFQEPQTATVEIRFRRTSGQVTNVTTRSVSSQGGAVRARDVEKVSPLGSFREVRVRLKVFIPDSGLGPVSSVAASQVFVR